MIFMTRRGFTLIELILSVALLAVLATFVIRSLNPVGQIGQARNTERLANLNTIIIAIGENIADNKGKFSCASGALPTSSKKMAVGSGNYDIAPCLIPAYLSVLPADPSLNGAHFTSLADYDTGFTVVQNSSTTAVTLSAPGAEFGKTVSVSR